MPSGAGLWPQGLGRWGGGADPALFWLLLAEDKKSRGLPSLERPFGRGLWAENKKN